VDIYFRSKLLPELGSNPANNLVDSSYLYTDQGQGICISRDGHGVKPTSYICFEARSELNLGRVENQIPAMDAYGGVYEGNAPIWFVENHITLHQPPKALIGQ
jgi:hypothetical protein